MHPSRYGDPSEVTYSELRRIPVPRTRVNRGQRMREEPEPSGPLCSSLHRLLPLGTDECARTPLLARSPRWSAAHSSGLVRANRLSYLGPRVGYSPMRGE